MTTIHVQCIGDKALLPQTEFERLVELAQRHEEVTVQSEMRLGFSHKAFSAKDRSGWTNWPCVSYTPT